MKLLVYLLPLIFALSVRSQPYRYISESKVMGVAGYLAEIKADPNARLVEINKAVPGIILDIRYATRNNFMHRQMYAQPRAFARWPVVLALRQVEEDLKTHGLGLKIFDAYRPYSITVKFYEMARDTNFVADPRKGSKHNRGCAVDLTLINIKTGKELDMPTGFDSFSKKAAANYTGLPTREVKNRELLKRIMQAHGFTVVPTEWWHYDYNGWFKYPLLDIPFAAL